MSGEVETLERPKKPPTVMETFVKFRDEADAQDVEEANRPYSLPVQSVASLEECLKRNISMLDQLAAEAEKRYVRSEHSQSLREFSIQHRFGARLLKGVQQFLGYELDESEL